MYVAGLAKKHALLTQFLGKRTSDRMSFVVIDEVNLPVMDGDEDVTHAHHPRSL